jgi:hypothetical protein
MILFHPLTFSFSSGSLPKELRYPGSEIVGGKFSVPHAVKHFYHVAQRDLPHGCGK